MSSSDAALPWGRVSETDNSAEQKQAERRRSPIFDPKLDVGQRIEVFWQVTDEESGESSEKWWGATLLQQPSDADDIPTWQLRYDATDAFEEEESSVRFLSAKSLLHIEDGSMLQWRLEGCASKASDTEEGEEVINLRDISAAYEDLEREMGQTWEQAAMKELQTLDPHQQRHLVSGFNDIMEGMAHQLKVLVDKKDPNYVVTGDDIKEIFANGIKRQRTS